MTAPTLRQRAEKFLEPFVDEMVDDPEDSADLVDHLEQHFNQVDRHGEERGRRLQSAEGMPGCRVISTDSLCGDYPGEWFVAVGFREEAVAQLLADMLNAKAGEHAVRFYRVVSADYELQPGFEP